MSGQSELLASFGQLTEAIQGLAVNNAIKKAQVKVDELNQNAELNQFEKIKQQQSIAKGVSAAILGMGGSASAAQTAAASLAPDIPDMQMARLEATGKGTLADAATALRDEEEKRQLDKETRAFKRQQMLQDAQFKQQERLAKLKAEGKAVGKPIPPTVTNKLSDLMDMKSQLSRLKDDYAEKGTQIGPVNSRLIPNALVSGDTVAYTADVKDFFNQYRRAITGAAASIPELKSLLPAIPNEKDWGGDFLAKIDRQLTGLDSAVKNRIKLLRAQGRDTTDLEEALGISLDEEKLKDPYGAANAPAGSTIPVNQSAAPASGNMSSFIKFNP